jgi:hypothetical protein
MQHDLPTIDVPFIQEVPAAVDAVAFADYLLGQLIAHSPASIEASHDGTHSDEQIPCNLSFARQGAPRSLKITELPKRHFRAVLARIGHHYMGDQLYFGFANRTLKCDEHEASCILYLGNCSQTGFWIKMFSSRNNAG